MDRDASALLRMAARLNAQLGLDEVLLAVCEELAAAFTMPIATVTLVDGELLRTAASVGLTDADRERLTPVPVAEYLSLLTDQNDLTYVADVQALARGNQALYRDRDIRSVATAVLRHGDQFVGLLAVTSRHEVRPFTERDA